MRKILLLTFLFALFSLPARAADYYANACNGQNMSGASSTCTWDTNSTGSCTASGGTALVWANRQAGDVFHANGCASIPVDVNPGLSSGNNVTLSTVTGTGTAGGTFAVNTALTLDVVIIAGTTPALTLSGTAAVTIGQSGCTITGGSSASANGVSDTHTTAAVTVNCNITGGSNASAVGYTWNGATGSIALTGNATAATAVGFQITGAGGATVAGNCIGSDTANVIGCKATAAGTITITGNIINGKRDVGAGGPIIFTPGATNCVVYMRASGYGGGSTPSTCASSTANIQQMPSDTNIKTTTNVITGVTYGGYTGTGTSASNSGSAH